MPHPRRPLSRTVWLVPVFAAIFLVTHQAVTGFDGNGLLASAIRGAVLGVVVLCLVLALDFVDARTKRRKIEHDPAPSTAPQYAYGPPDETEREPRT
jgi:hypothetical protein